LLAHSFTRAVRRQIKEKMTSDSDKGRHDRLVKAFLGDSAEELERRRRRDYRQGYPKATEAEIQLLIDADDKAGYSWFNAGVACGI
jgi:hypothetical protein